MTPWSDFLPKVALAAANALLLAGAAAVAAYLFNKKLERHKRNEAIAGELAKQSLSGYLRMLACVSEVNALLAFWEFAEAENAPLGEHPLEDPEPLLRLAFKTAFQGAPLVSHPFAAAVIGFVGFASRHLDEYRQRPATNAATQAKLREQRLALMTAIGKALPKYVRLPDEDFFKATESIEDLYVSVGIWRRDEAGNAYLPEADTASRAGEP